MIDLKNKTVLIIGATGGIGSAAARDLSAKGSNLILFSRNSEKLHHLENELNNTVAIEGDALSEVDFEKAVQLGIDRFGKIDALIHSVGSILLKPLLSTSIEKFNETLELNLVSPFKAIQAVLPSMVKNSDGSIIVFSSVAASKGLMNHEAISAAKGGLEAMIRSAAITYAKKGIRFNSIALGLIETELSKFITSNELSLKASVGLHPLGRIGKPDDILGTIRLLVSDESKWITGTTFHIDGGMST